MEKAEIKHIADYIKDLEKGLDGWDFHGITTQRHLTKLHLAIKRLMDTTCKTKDQQLKVLLTILEYKARRCKQSIETRLAVKSCGV